MNAIVDCHGNVVALNSRVSIKFLDVHHGNTHVVDGLVTAIDHRGATVALSSPAVWRGQKQLIHKAPDGLFYVFTHGQCGHELGYCYDKSDDWHEIWKEV